MSAVLGIAQQTISALQPDDQVIDVTPEPSEDEPSKALVPQAGGVLVPPPPPPMEVVSSEHHEEDVVYDYDYVRKTLFHLIEKGNEALDHLLPLAKESESPRSFEVMHMLLKTTSEMARDLLGLHNSMNDIQAGQEKPKNDGNVTNIQNNTAVFVGTTTELQRIARQALLDKGE